MVSTFAARAGKGTIPITPLLRRDFRTWLAKQSKPTRAWLGSIGFVADAGAVALVPGRTGELARVVLGLGTQATPWEFAPLAAKLPKGRYAFDDLLKDEWANDAALGWGLATYTFDKYRPSNRRAASLVWPAKADRAYVTYALEASTLGRNLINTPAGDMSPEHLQAELEDLGKSHGARTIAIVGDKLLDRGYPAIHAVGRASATPPRLIDLRWGDDRNKRLTLVGKGVCFDSGGLDLKSAAGMKLMKKDMGGAASVMALAHMIMAAELPVRLRLLVPAVENSVSSNAYRPGDVLATRKGLTVEVGNTDAEGRIILSDALAEADTDKPDVLLDFATLTGAARTALGTELPALFCDDDDFVQSVIQAGVANHDPLWRMPLHRPYRRHLDSPIADLNNISSVPQGGAITAALFLQEFVSRRRLWAHVDTMGWNTSNRAGRPSGGEVFGIRAMFAALRQRYQD